MKERGLVVTSKEVNMTEETSEKPNTEAYLAALQHLSRAGQWQWQVFAMFLLAHTAFLSFVVKDAFDSCYFFTSRWDFFISGIVGLLICVPWASAHFRTAGYYRLRMAQAKELEPDKWKLLNGEAESFSNGKTAKIGDKTYKLNLLGRMRTKWSIPYLITIISLVYLFVIVINGPWWD